MKVPGRFRRRALTQLAAQHATGANVVAAARGRDHTPAEADDARGVAAARWSCARATTSAVPFASRGGIVAPRTSTHARGRIRRGREDTREDTLSRARARERERR